MQAAFAVIAMNLSAMRGRIVASAVVVVAILALAGITTSILSVAAGFMGSQAQMKSPDRAMVLSASAPNENQSSISRAAALKIGDLPGVKRGADGKPIMTTEIVGNIPVNIRETNRERGFAVRGVNVGVMDLRPAYKIVEGRMFQPGLRELIVGKGPHETLMNMNIGDKVRLPDGQWTVVGVFACGGRCEWRLYGDIDTLMTTFRKTSYNSVVVRLENADAFAAFKAALGADPTLQVTAEREPDYWERFEGPQYHFYQVIGFVVGGIIGLGVIFASANMMYAAVSRRVLEIATLRALGFGTGAVIASVIAEAVILAAIGAVGGIFIAWLACDNVWYMGGNFNLAVPAKLAAASLAATLGVGVLAALFPAIRAARLPVAAALQMR
ncbi:MAG: ABC transporter permease [Rhodospirillaceae bacterium]|nr:ABC transporter permease [Rhodospirillaceae bacterium]